MIDPGFNPCGCGYLDILFFLPVELRVNLLRPYIFLVQLVTDKTIKGGKNIMYTSTSVVHLANVYIILFPPFIIIQDFHSLPKTCCHT